MLTIDSIKEEPTIRVGIVLPEDRFTEIKLSIPQKATSSSKNIIYGDIAAQVFEDKININNNLYEEVTLNPEDHNDYLMISDVPAGRGFHWQKKIDIEVPGVINIKNVNGYLLVVNQIPLEQYIKYVAISEMSSECPSALLEAQAIAARSWLLNNLGVNHPGSQIDVCNDDCCQRYQGIIELPEKAEMALKNAFGKVLSHGGTICDARYSKCCGGITESFENVWDGEPHPYLSSIFDATDKDAYPNDVEDFITSQPEAYCSPQFVNNSDLSKYLGKVDKNDNYFRWQLEYSSTELINILKSKQDMDIDQLLDFIPLKRGKSGRITKLQIKYVNSNNDIRSIVLRSEYTIRNTLHEKFLYSSAFLIEKSVNEQGIIESIKLTGAGWGHGVGMCQFGALGMALDDYNSEEILKHYFMESAIVALY